VIQKGHMSKGLNSGVNTKCKEQKSVHELEDVWGHEENFLLLYLCCIF
jgi:hypothetical protein